MALGKSVWLVSAGSYEEHAPASIFSTKELAQQYIEQLPPESEVDSEPQEWPIDLPRERLPGVWCVTIYDDPDNKDDGMFIRYSMSKTPSERPVDGPSVAEATGATLPQALAKAKRKWRKLKKSRSDP